MKDQHPPLLTFKSFVISFIIILVVYLSVHSMFDKPKESKKAPSLNSSENFSYDVIDGEENSNNSILSIPVQGIIFTEGANAPGFFDSLAEGGITYGYEVKEELKRAAKDPDIKAVLIEINSPGGTVGGSKAISDGITQYKEETGNPVYAHITDVGASGGYWSASATDYIMAEEGSTTGSIGVIMGPFKYYDGIRSEQSIFDGVESENGIDYRYFSAGQYKDTGSPYRKMSPEEIDHWQTSLNNEYDKFVSYVSTHRKLQPEFIKTQIKALPYENKRAIQLGLIDAEGSRDDSIAMLAKKAGLKEDDYKVIRENNITGFFDKLFTSVAYMAPKKQVECQLCAKPLYLYDSSYSLVK